MKRTRIILPLLIISLLVLSACTGGIPFSRTSTTNQNRDYYTGTDGVIMRFSDPSSPPARMYYYESGDFDDNGFQIMVDVHNIGSAWTKGALYVSGYDPYMLQIDNIDIAENGASWLSSCFITGVAGGSSSLGLNCQNVDVTLGNGFGFSTTDLGGLLGDLGIQADVLNGVRVNLDTSGDNVDFGFSIDDSVDADLFNNGRGLIIALSGLSLTQYNGLNYEGDVAGAGILQPDTPEFPGGEMNTILFNGLVRNWPQGFDQTDKPVTFLVTNCFVYSTTATPQVCIDPAPYDQGVKVCQPRRVTFNGGNGAPVAISTIEQENALRKVYFDITIRNVGGGTVFDVAAMQLCSPYYPGRLTQQHLDKVYLLDARIGGQQLDCTPNRGDGIRMVNGVGNLRCSYDMEYATAKSAYETPLVLEIGYGYSTTMRRSTVIRRVI